MEEKRSNNIWGWFLGVTAAAGYATYKYVKKKKETEEAVIDISLEKPIEEVEDSRE